MNHDFIQTLVNLYNELPESNPELAARRVAVLIEHELEKMEKEGVVVNRFTLHLRIQTALEEHKKAA